MCVYDWQQISSSTGTHARGPLTHLDHTTALPYSPDYFKQIVRLGDVDADAEVGLLLVHQSEELFGGRIRVERDPVGVAQTGFRGGCLRGHRADVDFTIL